MEKAVCPPELNGGLFATTAVDNIDHNPSSTNSHDSFHGTGISFFQHPDQEFSGSSRVVTAQTSREVGGDKKQRWSRGHKARGQGQEQECWRPRPRTKDTNPSVFRKKKIFKKFFSAISEKTV